jgi:hypothetical protein
VRNVVRDLEALRRELDKLAERRLVVALNDSEQHRYEELCNVEAAEIRGHRLTPAQEVTP